jgi:hypothetical protein
MPAKSAQREDATPDGWYWVKDVGGDAGGIQNSMKARPAVSSAAPDLAAGSYARRGLARGLPGRVTAGRRRIPFATTPTMPSAIATMINSRKRAVIARRLGRAGTPGPSA